MSNMIGDMNGDFNGDINGDNITNINNQQTPRKSRIEPITSGRQWQKVAVLHEPYESDVWLKIGLDIFVLILFSAIIIILVAFAKPFNRGFNCDDETIRYPYHDDTVTPFMLGFYPFTICLLTILLNEYFIIQKHCSKNSLLTPMKWKLYCWQLYHQMIPLLFALCGSQMITHISKYTIGRLRPHFIDVCRPKILSTNEILDRFSSCTNGTNYYTDYECTRTGTYPYQLIDSRLSFMSGHSSHMAVSMVYLMLYLHSRFCWVTLERIQYAYQAILFSIAFWVSLTRISDYKHHWSDVLIGFLQGTIFAILTALYASNLFKFESNRKQCPKLPQQAVSPNFESIVSINMHV